MAVRLSALCAGRKFTPRKIPRTHFCYRLNRPQGHMAGRIRSIEKSSDLIVNRTRNLSPCSIMPQPTMLPHPVSSRSKITRKFEISNLVPVHCSRSLKDQGNKMRTVHIPDKFCHVTLLLPNYFVTRNTYGESA
jgi:hypothetical protein